MERIQKKKEWSTQEISLLSSLYPQFSSKRWKRISQNLREKGFSRSEIECRQKWINFLDPSLNRNSWTDQQLQRLYEMHSAVGTRWCVIQKYIGRTQNKIKNRFYGTLRNYIRFSLGSIEGSKICYNYQISKLSPNFLNTLYHATGNFSFLGKQVKEMIYAMRFKVDKKMLAEKLKQKRDMYKRMNALILLAFKNINMAGQQASISSSEESDRVAVPQNQAQSTNEGIQASHQPYYCWTIPPITNYSGVFYWCL